MGYVGRFAPSPTGPLHLGSLTTAVASYLHARQRGGKWLVRIEDVDPPREQQGAAGRILRTLEAYGLHWDGDVLHQSTRAAAYRDIVLALLACGLAFRCGCSRKDVQASSRGARRYPGTCRRRAFAAEALTAVRVRVDDEIVRFDDGIQGAVVTDLGRTEGDYLIYRRDQLPAYHLAVVADDAYQGVTAVVRGADLLEPTAVQLHLQRQLGLPAPRYWHVPVLVDAHGAKLSKQTGAAPVGDRYSPATARRVLELLGLRPPPSLENDGSQALWAWAIAHWRVEELIGRAGIHSS